MSFNGTDGRHPWAGLIEDAASDLFGTTYDGGACDDGTVFEIVDNGGSYASIPTTLVNFNGNNGQYPQADLFADAAGDLFGTTVQGGADSAGTVFELSAGFVVPTTVPEPPSLALLGTAVAGLFARPAIARVCARNGRKSPAQGVRAPLLSVTWQAIEHGADRGLDCRQVTGVHAVEQAVVH